MHGCHILAWTAKEVFVYKFDDGSTSADRPPLAPVLVSSFEYKCSAGAIYGETLYLATAGTYACMVHVRMYV